MCLAIPSEIIDLDEQMATIDVSGIRRRVSLLILGEPVNVGDYVLVHAGFAIHKMDPQAAQDALALLSELGEGEPDP